MNMRPEKSPACWKCSRGSRTRGSSAGAATCSPSSSRSPSRARWPGRGTSARSAITELDYSHGRIIRRSLWATTAEGIDFPHVTRAARIRRDGYDLDGTLISKEIVHAVTSLDAKRASAADLAKIARGQWGIESVHWLRDTTYAEDASTGYTGNGPQVIATLRNLAISLLHLAGVTEITRSLQAIGRDRTRLLDYLPLSNAELK